ncbi:MAG: glucose 1-dehydrogenase [Bryobacteraceae bacterium]|nr:glucose 1-dehydrogenase [Bryobacteraceae bacterium]
MAFLDLTGQTAVVTGGAAGIGEAISARLARAGAKVYIADIDGTAAASTAAKIPNASALPMDVTKSASVNSAIASVGKIDILVNNAGTAGIAAPVTEQTDAEWQRVVEINLFGVVFTTRAVIPGMRERGYGRIVNIASIAGKEGNPNMTAYSATKAAVIGFTKSVAKEVATAGICVNAVSPAVVRTKILDQLTPEQVGYMTSKIPMGRTGTPEEIAAVVHFLASPDASFVTAQTYDASGGRATY